ncbi:alpha/beta fold hydrolase [Dechloromonas denitrificans]|uniref:alpha/beta fold hydrolase n=1 Tax=Dechloromonas denitrificans TaxID=281362 RepID=UPI001CF80100|nr:alpha/beta hydrolase [Dechloromonas denitrificans]UCV04630.1 alpha/beta hydrolase [Dechloromonas denitrificans]
MKPKILLLPGLLNDASLFTEQMVALSALGSVQVGDLTRSDSIGELAADVLAGAPDGRLVLVGLSMGGYVAFEIMRTAPQRVAALVLMDTTARPDTPEASALREELIKLAETDLEAVTERLLARLSHPDLMNQPAVRGVIQSMASGLGKEVFIRQQRAIMSRPDSRPTLAGIACPTLVICGREDQITPPEMAEEIAAGIKHAELKIIEQCGHLSTLDQPEQVSNLLLEWIKALK